MNTITIENLIEHRPCIKRTSVVFIGTDLRILLVQNTLKKIKIPSFNILQPENRPQLLELRVGLLRRCWREGEHAESHFHFTMGGMRQTISRHCRMMHSKQRKRRENACIKALVFTAQASCGF